RAYPRYPARGQVVEYLERYAGHFGLVPLFRTEAIRAKREDDDWRGETNQSPIPAPGLGVSPRTAGFPPPPHPPGPPRFRAAVPAHAGPWAAGGVWGGGPARPGGGTAPAPPTAGPAVTVAVRGPVNIVPRELFGVPILTWAIVLSRLPPGLADLLAAPLIGLGI